jgi:hypothetical protein
MALVASRFSRTVEFASKLADAVSSKLRDATFEAPLSLLELSYPRR